ncbi:hypothetical protein [Ruminococcus gauvreauii]|uniref:Response regulatory domain-containing protein n=1 Tax=Ruminococcus gauvreauii TaxID=438033 RepID=A0ABY5VJP8_9FIRM|nr:hypothetical protein [Ruminococcus gauvreauii]UWP60186.1 hypothetical protein NQ502_03785 [Ruminococcus gauvreauii]
MWRKKRIANSFQEDADAAFAAGMTEFVPKPVDLQHSEESSIVRG